MTGVSAGSEPVGRRHPDLRLVPAVSAAWAAAWWGTAAGAPGRNGLAGAAPAVACLVALGLAAVGLVMSRGVPRRADSRGGGRFGAAPVLVLSVMAAVLATCAVACATRYHAPLPRWAADRAVVEVRAQVTDDPRQVTGGPPGRPPEVAVRIAAHQLAGRGISVRVGAPLLLLGSGAWQAVSAGQTVIAVGRLRAADPGDDVVALLTAQGGPRAVSRGSWPWRLADRLRGGLRRACAGLPTDAGGLLPSLVVGDTSALPDRLRSDLQAAGLTHITAVSGANVAISAGAALWVSSALGAGRRLRLVLTAVVLAGFVVVARPQPSVLRAAAMGGVGLLGLAGARQSRGLPLLAGSGVLLLAIDPWLARSTGFALSCLATAGLLLLAPLWTGSLSRRLPRVLAAGVAVPAAAQAMCGPILVLLQPSVSIVSVPANLLAEPAVAPATVLGLVAALVAPLWPVAAEVPARLGGLATGWIALVAHRAAGMPWGSLPWPSGPGGAVLLAGFTAALIVVTTRWRLGDAGRDPWGAPPRLPPRAAGGPVGPQPSRVRGGAGTRHAARRTPGRRWLAVGVLALLAAVIGWWAGSRLPPWGPGPWPPPDWAVVQCDVGQGAALVARSGVDRAVLVDTGPDPRLMTSCLDRLNVRHLDLVLLTHFHADHVGGLPGVLARRDVREVLVSPLAEPAENAEAVARELAVARVPERVGAAGQSGAADGAAWSVRWRVLAPAQGASPRGGSGPSAAGGDHGDEGSVVNEASLAYVLDVRAPSGSLRLVGMGDLERDGQQALLAWVTARPGVLGPSVDVVEVAHHGSAKQIRELYATLRPRVALIGVGAGNEYGHPAPSTLAMLHGMGVEAFRTDTDGAIAVSVRPGGALSAAPLRGAHPGQGLARGPPRDPPPAR
ncbi:MAG TPA: ComEC/Rec2 family competence protein [Kineosporiaceae bacterium]